MVVSLMIYSASKAYIPAVEEGITWQTERKGTPGELKFKVVKDGTINFAEGDAVELKVDGKGVFWGYVFSKKRDKDGVIDVTAYDQLRYFKNKYSYVYENITAAGFLRMVAEDYDFKLGEIEDTGFKIATRTEENKTLFDMVQNALDLTLQNKKEMYVMYDDFGKIALKNIASMMVNLMINEETGENFSYSSSIDTETYNKIVLYDESEPEASKKFKVAKDTGNIKKWGVLQYFDTFQEGENGQAKANALLQLYNKKTRSLSISNVFGDTRIRAGCMVVVQLNLGDIKTNHFMLVEKCKHTFRESEHFMDVTLRGGEFVA